MLRRSKANAADASTGPLTFAIGRFECAVLSAAIAVVLGLLGPAPAAHAQGRIQAQEEKEEEQQTRETPAMRETVYQKLTEAQTCAEMDDFDCARELLEDVKEMRNLSGYETAQMWSFYAYIYFQEENYPEAISAYENVLKQENVTEGLQLATLRSLAGLYMQQERYQEALDTIDRWFALDDNPGADAYMLKAQAYYSMEKFADGIPPILDALRVAEEQGKEPQEGWYQLLNVLYFETENFPKVIETLTTMLEKWPKAEYMIQLASIYGQEGDDARQVALFQAAYAGGWLTRSADLVNLAQMLLQANVPYSAARVLEKGLDDGTIDSTLNNWRLLGQALNLAQEDEAALPAWSHASSLAEDGDIDHRLAQSYYNLARWEDCVESARTGLKRGGLNRPDQANLLLGNCLVELKKYGEAKEAFAAAEKDSRSRNAAKQWLDYIAGEEARERTNAITRRNL